MTTATPSRLKVLLMRAVGVITLVLGAAGAVGAIWSVATRNGAPWQLIALVPNSLLTWWVGVGFFRWAADTERRALAKQAT